ncbi:hypothetical protein [Desertivirga arenae]|uniref:hypothetical protein n=1 Tax=Desertivirga arenae TaxID=2810309 RepID=UPI001A95DF22|nr:hypothetical protein [Pedobacter sp. SYSU D00823]
MVEVLRENWEFILYERKGSLYLFIVNGQGSLSEVTYKLSAEDVRDFKEKGSSFLTEKVRSIRSVLRHSPRLNPSAS